MTPTLNIPAKRTPIPFGVFFSVSALVFTLVFACAAIKTMLTPRVYAGTTQLEIRERSAALQGGAETPDIRQIATAAISSEAVLQKVIYKKDLNNYWGNKYFNGETLKSWQTLQLLQARLNVWVVPRTSLVKIAVGDDNPGDAAVLANEVANAYIDFMATNKAGVEVQIMDQAHSVNVPIRPNVALNLIFGAVAGIFIGVGAGLAAAIYFYIKTDNQIST